MIRRFIDFIRFPPPYEGQILNGPIDGWAYLVGWVLTFVHIGLAIFVFVLALDRPWPVLSSVTSGIGTLLFLTIVIVIHRRMGESGRLHREVVWQWWLGPWDSVGRLVWLPVRLPESVRAIRGQRTSSPE